MTAPVALDLDALEAVARAATHQEKWRVTDLRNDPDGNRDCIWIDTDSTTVYATIAEMNEEDGLFPIWGIEDATHIAAFDPPTVLALITRLREAEAVIEKVREIVEPPKPFELGKSMMRSFDRMIGDLRSALATYKPTNQEKGGEA